MCVIDQSRLHVKGLFPFHAEVVYRVWKWAGASWQALPPSSLIHEGSCSTELVQPLPDRIGSLDFSTHTRLVPGVNFPAAAAACLAAKAVVTTSPVARCLSTLSYVTCAPLKSACQAELTLPPLTLLLALFLRFIYHTYSILLPCISAH